MKALAVRTRLIALPRPAKQAILIGSDVLLLCTALTVAASYVAPNLHAAFRTGWAQWLLAVGLSVTLFAQAGCYRNVVRFGGNRVFLAVFLRVTVTALAMKAAQTWVPMAGFAVPSPTILVFWGIVGPMLIGSRLLGKAWLASRLSDAENVIIYGAGDAGAQLVSTLLGRTGFRPVALVDDNSLLHGRLLNNLPICSPADLPALVRDTGARRILLAIPSIRRRERLAIIRRLEGLPVHVQTVPDIGDLVSGRAKVDELREIGTLDLLGREPVPPNETLLRRCITGRSVMVTGAGGSIGSELCRQIVELQPERLVLFEISELALYTLEAQLRERVAQHERPAEIVALLGSVQDRERVCSIMRTFRVQTVFHAAAYKHVPIVEHNMVEGIRNNIFGTSNTALAAEDAGVETFVLISTDKAVSPVNVMGASKRFAEMVLQGMAARGSATRFCMVRFGNVLESSGSVVPLFREQIRRGGPVTVTHPEVVRYFMTIPEAAQLVIQAGAMARGGDVFVLDMGRPVRIDALARRMILLAGFTVRDADNPDGDIAIEYTGLRPGEKLYEELLIGDTVAGTDHPSILRAYEESLPWPAMAQYLKQLQAATAQFDCARAHELLLESVRGFQPVCETIEDRVWQAAGSLAAAATTPAPAPAPAPALTRVV